jgi:hypothetical protein
MGKRLAVNKNKKIGKAKVKNQRAKAKNRRKSSEEALCVPINSKLRTPNFSELRTVPSFCRRLYATVPLHPREGLLTGVEMAL